MIPIFFFILSGTQYNQTLLISKKLYHPAPVKKNKHHLIKLNKTAFESCYRYIKALYTSKLKTKTAKPNIILVLNKTFWLVQNNQTVLDTINN